MSRTARAAVAFAFGAVLVLAGLAVGSDPAEAARRWGSLPPRCPNFDAFAAAKWFEAVARIFLAGGLATEGLGLAAWVVAPRDDR